MRDEGVLHEGLDASARRRPEHVAVVIPGNGRISYAALTKLSDRVRDRLWRMGVRPGDRVGVCCPKSIDTLAAIFGALKAGAAYVPCDPHAPASRNAYILSNCAVKAALVETRLNPALRSELAKLGAAPATFEIPASGDGSPLAAALSSA